MYMCVIDNYYIVENQFLNVNYTKRFIKHVQIFICIFKSKLETEGAYEQVPVSSCGMRAGDTMGLAQLKLLQQPHEKEEQLLPRERLAEALTAPHSKRHKILRVHHLHSVTLLPLPIGTILLRDTGNSSLHKVRLRIEAVGRWPKVLLVMDGVKVRQHIRTFRDHMAKKSGVLMHCHLTRGVQRSGGSGQGTCPSESLGQQHWKGVPRSKTS